MFYESLNVQNQMCELCTFSQMRSHMQSYLVDVHESTKELLTSLVYGILRRVLSEHVHNQ